MKTIAKFSFQTDADLAKSRLESAGIEVFTPDEVAGSWMLDGAAPMVVGIRLQVADQDVARALEILADTSAEGPASEAPSAQT